MPVQRKRRGVQRRIRQRDEHRAGISRLGLRRRLPKLDKLAVIGTAPVLILIAASAAPASASTSASATPAASTPTTADRLRRIQAAGPSGRSAAQPIAESAVDRAGAQSAQTEAIADPATVIPGGNPRARRPGLCNPAIKPAGSSTAAGVRALTPRFIVTRLAEPAAGAAVHQKCVVGFVAGLNCRRSLIGRIG